MRRLARVLPFALLPLFSTAAPLPPAVSGGVAVSMTSSSTFSPATVTVGQGTTVTWTNNGGVPHSSKSVQNFWDGPNIGTGGTYSQAAAFQNAGSYRYYCEVHGLGMSGTVRVRMKATGSSGAGWTIRWSSLATNPTNRTFDVKVDRPGTTGFESFRTNTSSRKAFFNPSRAGTYKFKSRTDIGTTSSSYSPVLTVTIS